MNVKPADYTAAIERQLVEEREIERLNAKAGIKSTGVVLGLEMAKKIIERTWRWRQEIL